MVHFRAYFTYISLHEPVEAIVYAVDGIATVDAVTYEGAHCGVHATSGGAHVNDREVVAALGKGGESAVSKCLLSSETSKIKRGMPLVSGMNTSNED